MQLDREPSARRLWEGPAATLALPTENLSSRNPGKDSSIEILLQGRSLVLLRGKEGKNDKTFHSGAAHSQQQAYCQMMIRYFQRLWPSVGTQPETANDGSPFSLSRSLLFCPGLECASCGLILSPSGSTFRQDACHGAEG